MATTCTTDTECAEANGWNFCAGQANTYGGALWANSTFYCGDDGTCKIPVNYMPNANETHLCIHPKALNGGTRYCGVSKGSIAPNCCPGSVCEFDPKVGNGKGRYVCQEITDPELKAISLSRYCEQGTGNFPGYIGDDCTSHSDCRGENFCGYENNIIQCNSQKCNRPAFPHGGFPTSSGNYCVHFSFKNVPCNGDSKPCCPGSRCVNTVDNREPRCIKIYNVSNPTVRHDSNYLNALLKSCGSSPSPSPSPSLSSSAAPTMTESLVVTTTDAADNFLQQEDTSIIASALLYVGIGLGVVAVVVGVVFVVLFLIMRKKEGHAGSDGRSGSQSHYSEASVQDYGQKSGIEIDMDSMKLDEFRYQPPDYDELVDPAALLEDLGVGDFIDVFETADLLNSDHILELSEEDLISLGLPLGARRRFRDAVVRHIEARAARAVVANAA